MPVFLFLMSLSVAMYSLYIDGPVLSDLLLLSLVACFAALLLMLGASFASSPRKRIVLDGSNILYWQGDTPDIDAVKSVVEFVSRKGYKPIIWFDANVGYLIEDQYLGPAALAPKLGVPKKQVFVAPKGTPADLLLLDDARARKASVISNDKFRDWQSDFPQVKKEGFLLSAKMRGGEMILKL